MSCREDLSVESALEAFVARAQLLEEEFFVEPVVEDLTEVVEPYVEEEDAETTLPQDTIPACIPQRTLVVSMMATAALSALAAVLFVRPAALPARSQSMPKPLPKIEVSLPRAQPLPAPAPAPAPTVTQLAAGPPAPIQHAPAARSHAHKKRALTAKVSRRDWSVGFAE